MINQTPGRTGTACIARALCTLGAAVLLLTSTGWGALAGDTGFAAVNAKAYQGAAAPTAAPKAASTVPPMGGHGVARKDRDACKPVEGARKAGNRDPGGDGACNPIEDARKAGSGDPGGDGA
jgi:hypothetical protein